MTEYWKSVGNYYCDYCKTFVRNDAFSRRQHESSPRHEGALKRQVRDIHRKSEREAQDLARTNRELARIGGKVTLPSKAVETPKNQQRQQQQPVVVKTKKVKVKAEKKGNTLDDASVYTAAMAQFAKPKEDVQTVEVDEEQAAAHRAALAQHAIPGPWTAVESVETVDDAEPKPDTSMPAASLENIPAADDDLKAEVDEPSSEHIPESHAISAASELPTSTVKRRRDGADEDLLKFRVQKKKDTPDLHDLEDDVPVVSFKKKKKKPAN